MPPEPEGKEDHGAIVFFHPDLGIGGAERLVVDAAVGLQQRGHRVVIFTNHCDPTHCFDECRDGTLDVRVRAPGPIPMSILSRLTILCAILRHIHLLLLLVATGELTDLRPRAFVVDQLSAGLPLLRHFWPAAPVFFYCHFPDLLLARGRASALKRAYRVPFDWLEEWSMGFAQAVAVNSEFTRGVVRETWPRLGDSVPIKVVYPCVDTEETTTEQLVDEAGVLEGEEVLLSINRFEEKKDIGLAIRAFAAIPEEERKGVRLVLAGGYDARVSENVTYHTALQALATSLSLTHHTVLPTTLTPLTPSAIPPASVLFLLSIPSALKTALLRTATLLLYTPSREHFGIVPLEAMRARVPVLAANTGGPVETVLDGVTGWLRAPDDVPAWTAVVRDALALSTEARRGMGEAGAARVRSVFGREQMAEALEAGLEEIVAAKHGRPWFSTIVNIVSLVIFFAIGLVASSLYAKRKGAKA